MNVLLKISYFLNRIFFIALFLVACAGNSGEQLLSGEGHSDDMILSLPELEPVELNDRLLKVVATTNIIGDVVTQVGGNNIELLTLIELGQDPHSYEPGASELTTVTGADVIFVNGWDLEEGLVDNLAVIGEGIPIIPVNANIMPLQFGSSSEGGSNDHEHGIADPHTWLAVSNVQQWVENIATTLSDLDPANADTYKINGLAYSAKLTDLETELRKQIDSIPKENRVLISNHESLGYFADAYGFQILGTVIPSSSTLAEPSAIDLADLTRLMEEKNLCTIFTESTVSPNLSETVARELSSCQEVKVIELYTGSIGLPGSGADSYIGMMEVNIANIVRGLN